MKPIHIFVTGKHTDSHGIALEFSEADLARSVSAYDPALHQAPIVVGHPDMDAPAYGWVASLTASKGKMYATPEQVNPAFSEQVQAGTYKKVSASFYPPNSPANPVKGVYYLRHVGFLGGQPPAIKGLEPVEFGDSGEAVTLTLDFSETQESATPDKLGMFDSFVQSLKTLIFGEDVHASNASNASNTTPALDDTSTPIDSTTKDKPMPDNALPTTTATPAPAPATPLNTPVQPAQTTPPPLPSVPTPASTADAKDAEIARLQAELEAKNQAEAMAKLEARKQANADFSEGLVADGKIAPADKGMVTAVLDALDVANDATPLNFGEGDDAKPLADAFKDKLTALDASTFSHLFSESAGLDTSKSAMTSGYVAPPETAIDADRLAVHEKALAYAEAHKVDYGTAVLAIEG